MIAKDLGVYRTHLFNCRLRSWQLRDHDRRAGAHNGASPRTGSKWMDLLEEGASIVCRMRAVLSELTW